MQACARGWIVRRRYQQIRKTILRIQTYARGMLARIKFQEMKDTDAAITVQRFFRGCLVRRRVWKRKRHVILVQSCIRRWLARRVFRKLKAEARSVEHVKSLNKGLEMKIISLQQRMDEIVSLDKKHMPYLRGDGVDGEGVQ